MHLVTLSFMTLVLLVTTATIRGNPTATTTTTTPATDRCRVVTCRSYIFPRMIDCGVCRAHRGGRCKFSFSACIRNYGNFLSNL